MKFKPVINSIKRPEYSHQYWFYSYATGYDLVVIIRPIIQSAGIDPFWYVWDPIQRCFVMSCYRPAMSDYVIHQEICP